MSIPSGADFPAVPSFGERFDSVIGFLRRRYLIILVCLLASLPVAAFYHFASPPTYAASATMMIESRKSTLPGSGMADARLDAPWIESQIGILKSQNVAAYVVKQLRLVEDPQFTRHDAGTLDNVLARLGWRASEPGSDKERVGQAIASVISRMDVRRLGQSYIIRIDFRSQNPEQAIKVANAMIDGYIFEQMNAKYQANRRAGDWLQERLQTLREQTSAAERAVVEFKTKNNIVKASGTLMSDKQLTEVSEQFGAARARTADVQARLDRIETVLNAYQREQPASAADETVSEAMTNSIITSLRNRYLDLTNREADSEARLGKNHLAVVNLRNEIRVLRKSIRDELGRIEETHRSELEIAKKRQGELENAMAELVSKSTETNQAQIALFSLEAAAESYRKIYDNFLQMHTESVQQQSYPISDARPISSASIVKISPRPLLIWTFAILAGGALGVGIGMLREVMDRGFRTREQIRNLIDRECLALVPLVTDQTATRVGSGRRSLPVAAQTADFPGARSVSFAPDILRSIAEAPSSLFVEAIRSIKLAVDLNSVGQCTKVIGVTSCLPNEGKSTVAAATAALIAHGGAHVILVDCDLRNRSLSDTLTPDASIGIPDLVAGNVALADAVWTIPKSRMAVLPAGANCHLPNSTEMLASKAARSVFDSLQIKFDYVIVDLPPLTAPNDVRAAGHLIDSYILVVEWGATKVDAVKYALRNAPWMQDHIAGIVLNKVDMAAIGRYDSHGAHYHYGQPRQPLPIN